MRLKRLAHIKKKRLYWLCCGIGVGGPASLPEAEIGATIGVGDASYNSCYTKVGRAAFCQLSF